MAGRQIQCPSCNHLIRIPPSPKQAAQGGYTPESGRTWTTFMPPVNAERPKGINLEGPPPAEPPKK